MQALALTYFKRYKMEIDLAHLPPSEWPIGYTPIKWRNDLLEIHAEILWRSFASEQDAMVFPSLGKLSGCLGLMHEVVKRQAFIPEATWLIMGPNGPCGTVQALRERGAFGAIQNVGILPNYRGLGLGRALVLQSLRGMYQSGLGRATLEVTATNEPAVRLYLALGFRRAKVIYKAVPVTITSPGSGEACSVPLF